MASPAQPEDARTYRASSGTVILVLSVLLVLFLLGDTVVNGSIVQALLIAPWMLLALWIVYEISFVSHVRVDAHGATVQNLLRRTSFGWGHVRDIDLRWQLEFALDDGRTLTSWGGPARARPPRQRRDEDAEPRVPSGLRALTDIRDRWSEAAAADAPIRRTWDGPALIALAVIVLWTAAALVVVNLG
ncbi:PH domain-containing protein [Microbacterium sp. NPDC055502]